LKPVAGNLEASFGENLIIRLADFRPISLRSASQLDRAGCSGSRGDSETERAVWESFKHSKKPVMLTDQPEAQVYFCMGVNPISSV
jgi:hypothetical protein